MFLGKILTLSYDVSGTVSIVIFRNGDIVSQLSIVSFCSRIFLFYSIQVNVSHTKYYVKDLSMPLSSIRYTHTRKKARTCWQHLVTMKGLKMQPTREMQNREMTKYQVLRLSEFLDSSRAKCPWIFS